MSRAIIERFEYRLNAKINYMPIATQSPLDCIKINLESSQLSLKSGGEGVIAARVSYYNIAHLVRDPIVIRDLLDDCGLILFRLLAFSLLKSQNEVLKYSRLGNK